MESQDYKTEEAVEAIGVCYQDHMQKLNYLKQMYNTPDDVELSVSDPVTGEDIVMDEAARTVFKATLNMAIQAIEEFPFAPMDETIQ